MEIHGFTLILSGVSEITPELADALYEAMDGDIEFSMREGVACLEVARRSPSLEEAIASSIRAVEGTVAGLRVVSVDMGGTGP